MCICTYVCMYMYITITGAHGTSSEIERLCMCFFAATFDIQNSTAEGNGNGIIVTGEFITDSFAVGCFIVLQCNESTADIYRAIILSRNELEQTVSVTIDVPSATYKVYAYDIEDDGLPYEMPANIPENDTIIITAESKLVIRYMYNVM